jgi:hypothetical protein
MNNPTTHYPVNRTPLADYRRSHELRRGPTRQAKAFGVILAMAGFLVAAMAGERAAVRPQLTGLSALPTISQQDVPTLPIISQDTTVQFLGGNPDTRKPHCWC